MNGLYQSKLSKGAKMIPQRMHGALVKVHAF